MSDILTKYSYLAKKINTTWVVLTKIQGRTCQSPIHLIDNKTVVPMTFNKDNIKNKKFAVDNGFIFINFLSELEV